MPTVVFVETIAPFCIFSIIAKPPLTRDGSHIVPFGKFHRIGGAPLETFPSEKYDAPEEVGGDRKSFDSPIRK